MLTFVFRKVDGLDVLHLFALLSQQRFDNLHSNAVAVKDTVYIGTVNIELALGVLRAFSHNLTILVNRADRGQCCLLREFGYAGVNLVAIKRLTAQCGENALHLAEFAGHLDGTFLFDKGCFDVQQAHARSNVGLAGAVLFAVRIGNLLAQHLVTAADTEHYGTAVSMLQNSSLHTALAQPFQVAGGIFSTRNNNHIRLAQLAYTCYIAQGYTRNQLEYVEVCIVGHARNAYNCNINQLNLAAAADTLGKAVLILDINLQHRQHAYDRYACFFFNHLQAGAQDFYVTAELVDDNTLNHGSFVVLQQHQRAVDGSENATTVNICYQQHRSLGHFSHAHVDKIVLFDVDFRRAACTLDADNIELGSQRIKRLLYLRTQSMLHCIIFAGLHGTDCLTVDNNLGTAVAGRLQQNRIHQYAGLNVGCFSLHNLCASHFRTLGGDKGIQRHVLGFERCHLVAVLIEYTA